MPSIIDDESNENLIQPNARHQYSVTAADLPLSCPMRGMHLWNSHPRVYLPIAETGWAKCNYCGAEYTLQADGPQGVADGSVETGSVPAGSVPTGSDPGLRP
jgi:uncharacterized Zn-finger protein